MVLSLDNPQVVTLPPELEWPDKICHWRCDDETIFVALFFVCFTAFSL